VEARYIVDENGKRVSVILPIEEYERMIEALEELEDIRAYYEAKAELEHGEDTLVPWEKVKREIGSEYEEPTG
jgi:PHD/YefM family antitoxin component YafN of YafNO toxin-antitoxin module